MAGPIQPYPAGDHNGERSINTIFHAEVARFGLGVTKAAACFIWAAVGLRPTNRAILRAWASGKASNSGYPTVKIG